MKDQEDQMNPMDEERSGLLKTLSDILYLKHKKIPYPKVEIPDYFNIQTSETTLTINATKGGIDQFLEKYGALETPPEIIDLRPFRDPNRLWGSRCVTPAEKKFPEDISPYHAIFSRRADIIVESLRINFLQKHTGETVFYVTGPYPEGHYKKIDECDFNSLSVKIWWDYFDHDFSRMVGDAVSEKFKWIFVPLLKILKDATENYSLSEHRHLLSKYGPVEDLSDYYLSSAIKVIEAVDPDVFNKVHHPELTVDQKGWQQFLCLLKILRDEKDWFFVTHLYEGNDERFPFRLTSVLNKEEKPFVFKAIEFARPQLEEVPCIRIKDCYIAGNCHGLLIVAKWLKDFALSKEKEKFILNQWGRIPYLSLKAGCLEPEKWLLLEKFEEELDEPFFSAECCLRTREHCLLLRGNYIGFLKAAEFIEKFAFTDSLEGYGFIYEGKHHKEMAGRYFSQRMMKGRFFIGSLYVYGGFRFSPEYNPSARYATEIHEEAEGKTDFEEEFAGHLTHVIERSNKKFFELYRDKKNMFLKERILKSYDYT